MTFSAQLEAALQERRSLAIMGGRRKPAVKGEKVTIYFSSPMGAIDKVEGYLSSVSEHTVDFVPKRGRNEATIMSYYTPFWMVVKGWNLPAIKTTAWRDVRQEKGVMSATSKYTAYDPRWISDFMTAGGKKLKPMAIYHNRKLRTFGKVSQRGEQQAEAVDRPLTYEVWPKDVKVVSKKWESRRGPKRPGMAPKDEVMLVAKLEAGERGLRYEISTPWLTDKDDEKEWIFAMKAELSQLLRKGKSRRLVDAKTGSPAKPASNKIRIL